MYRGFFMSATAEKIRTERLNLRVTSDQARLIRRAATATKANLSSFLVESACLRAEEALAAQQTEHSGTAIGWSNFRRLSH